MFSRSWYAVFAAIGLAIATPGIAQNNQSHQAQDSNSSGDKPSVANLVIEITERAKADDKGCEKGTDNRQSDLCAQWKSADAATDSALWGFWSLFATVVGLIVGGGTLIAAWCAAAYAKRAANHTKEANRILRQLERPYLVAVDPIIISELPTGTTPASAQKVMCALGFKIQNCGKGPAFIERFEAELRDEVNVSNVSHVSRAFFAVAMEQETIKVPDNRGRNGFDIVEFEAAFGSTPTRSCQMNFTIQYRDVFGVTRTTKSGYRRHPYEFGEPLIVPSHNPKDWRDEQVGQNV
jgi:hypothetical protein